MITKEDWLDGSKATFRKVFCWPYALSEAGDWVLSVGREKSFFGDLFLFLSDTAAQPDNRITRYRKMSRRPIVKRLLDDGCELIGEGLETSQSGLLFWCIIHLENQTLPLVIDHLRLDRGSFLFFAREVPDYDATLAKILRSRAKGSHVSIDQETIDKKTVVAKLVKDNLIPIRIWGPSGDRELWAEIYAH